MLTGIWMFTTIVFFAVFLGLIALTIVLWAVFLGLGLRWAKVEKVTKRRIAATTAIVISLQIALNILFFLIASSVPGQPILRLIVELAIGIGLPCIVIGRVFKIGMVQSLKAWLPTLGSIVISLLVSFLLIRPFVFEAFMTPTNAMAPTLIGNRSEAVCKQCGQTSYGRAVYDQYGSGRYTHMICDNFHVHEVSDVGGQVRTGDKFIVAKFMAPRRWDAITFERPGNRSVLYVMRVVGMPDETIHIQDGAVWVNGKKLTPPQSLSGIEYVTQLPSSFQEGWGTADRPAKLGKDEYFVLGDFSVQSFDSRFWKQGAPGRNTYAVPESHIKGVVTHRYWPLSRWRVIR